jgi:hypothetical protein
MWVAERWRMRRTVLALGLALLAGGVAHALTLESPRIEATLMGGSAKDPFRIRGRLGGVDLGAVVAGPVTVRFGDEWARVPAGGFRNRRGKFVWKSYLLGVKKVTINTKKGTIDVRGGGVELGDLPGPVLLALGTAAGAMCGEVTWDPAAGGGSKRRTRRLSLGPFAACDQLVAAPSVPLVAITSPTASAGTAVGEDSVSLAGIAAAEAGIASMSWTNDRGGSGTIAPAANWTLADVALQPGDNRITVTATDGAGRVGSDTLDVTYNTNGIAFDGVLRADPDYLFSGTRRAVTFRQGIVDNADLDPESVVLLRVADDGSTTLIDTMGDGGDLGNGDAIASDGFYSSLTSLDATTPGDQRFRVAARTQSAPEEVALSPVITLPVITHVPKIAFEQAMALADDASAMLQQLTAAGVPADEVLAQVVALAHAYGVVAVGPSDGGRGAWWVTADGLLGGAYGHDQTAKRGGSVGPPAAGTVRRSRAVGAAALGADAVQVGTRKTLILAPYFEDEEPAEIQALLEAPECPSFDVDAYTGTAADAEEFKKLEEYGLIVVASHGDALFGGIGAAYHPEWGWSSTGSQGTVLTGTRLSSLTLQRWEADLRLGRLAIMPGGMVAILPSFITHYSVRLPGSLVYLGACNTTANPTLATAFMGLGATTVLGFDGYVASAFARDVAVDLFSQLVGGATVGEAFTPGQTDGGTPPATFTLLGSEQTSIATSVIVNPGFEYSTGFVASVAGFTVQGDGRVISRLGTWWPTEGQKMAIVSTGLGLTKASGSFAQSICLPPLPPGATTLTLSWDWNFFSEEFIEYCGSEYQDSFEVTLGPTSLQSSKVDDLCPIVVPDPIDFDQGDVWTTGWKTQTVDVTAFAGTNGNLLKFAAKDVGDSIYDSAILVDNVRLVAE